MVCIKRIRHCLLLAFVFVTPVLADALTTSPVTNSEWQSLQVTATQAAYAAIQQHANEENTMQASPSASQFKPFPINTSAMTPGTLAGVSKPTIFFTQPIFIIGSDALSKQWLQQNREQLKADHAIGFLVQAQNQADIDAMKQLADGLLLIPASGNIFAQKLKLSHYPVLITKEGMVQ